MSTSSIPSQPWLTAAVCAVLVAAPYSSDGRRSGAAYTVTLALLRIRWSHLSTARGFV